jgi:hypothetical protein
LQIAVELAAAGGDPHAGIGQLGEGWIAEEALAIALYCALVAFIPMDNPRALSLITCMALVFIAAGI